jgi:serine protease Do
VGELHPGDKIHLTVLRDGTEKNFTVTLKGDLPVRNMEANNSNSAAELFNKLGASFMPVNQEQKQQFHINAGVVVTQVTSVNHKAISSVNDMDSAITNTRNGLLVISGFYPDGTAFSNTFQVQ